MPTAKSTSGMVAEMSHHWLGDGLPKDRHRHGDAGQRRIELQRLSVIEHREAKNPFMMSELAHSPKP